MKTVPEPSTVLDPMYERLFCDAESAASNAACVHEVGHKRPHARDCFAYDSSSACDDEPKLLTDEIGPSCVHAAIRVD